VLFDAFTLEEIGPGRYRANNASSGPGPIFGGQMIGQAVVAASAGHEGKTVSNVQTVFARNGSSEHPIELTVTPIHAGRSYASSSVSVTQGERELVRSLVLLAADEPDFIAHADPMPEVGTPDDARASASHNPNWEIRFAGGVDLDDPAYVGPPDTAIWTRFPDAPTGDAVLDQALLAYASEGFLIGTAMVAHDGVGQSQAHRTLSTAVITHSLTYHAPAPAGEWLLLDQHSTYAGRGKLWGHGNVYTAEGVLVASFAQDAMLKPMGGQGVF